MQERHGPLGAIAAWLVLAACVWLATTTAGRATAQETPVLAAGRCIACGQSTEGVAGAGAVEHAGRAVQVCSPPCAAHFAANADLLFAQFQARGALFDETSMVARDEHQLFSAWFWLGVWVVLGLVGGAWAAFLALSKGLEPAPWLWRGLAFNLIAVVAVALKPAAKSGAGGAVPPGLAKIPATAAPRDCPGCGGPNHPNARRCVGCGATLAAGGESESQRALRPARPN